MMSLQDKARTCFGRTTRTVTRPSGCPGDCRPPKFPYMSKSGLTRLAFGKRVTTPDDMILWRDELGRKLITLLDLPAVVFARKPPHFEVLAEERLSGYCQSKLKFTCFDGDSVPLYLLVPDKPLAEPCPAVFICHGHSKGARSAIGEIPDLDGQKGIGRYLAQRGFVVMAPELRTFGEREIKDIPDPYGRWPHEIVANYLMALGKPLMALTLGEVFQCLDLLSAWPGVDPARIGVCGLSQGGRLAIFTCALDPRPAACLSASGFTSYLEISRGNEALHDSLPGLFHLADYTDVAAMIAPRPFYMSWGAQEPFPYCIEARDNFSHSYVKIAYSLLGYEDNLVLDIHEQGHTYNLEGVAGFLQPFLAANSKSNRDYFSNCEPS